MDPRPLKRGEIVQIDPSVPIFGGCLMVVDDPKEWGAQGYIQNAGTDGLIWLRPKFENMMPIGGYAPWRPKGHENEDDS